MEGKLVFAEVTETVFTIVAVSDHDAFDIGSAEWRRLFAVNNMYIQSQMTPGTIYISHPIMSSGHPWILSRFSDYCEAQMQELDEKLDDPNFIDRLYNGQPVERDGQPIKRPKRPSFKWGFNDDMNFGIHESKTGVFFTFDR